MTEQQVQRLKRAALRGVRVVWVSSFNRQLVDASEYIRSSTTGELETCNAADFYALTPMFLTEETK